MDKILRERRERKSLRPMVRHDVLCFIIDDKKLLMIKKSPELFGGGKWNGLGGKIGVDESPEEACVREVYEESGLLASNLKYHGALKFWFGNPVEPFIICYVYSTNSFEGQLKESHEGILQWIDYDKIPYEEMWEDDQHWLPMLLQGKSFNGEFYFNSEGTKLLRHRLQAFHGEEFK